jgi:hypothetical protein
LEAEELDYLMSASSLSFPELPFVPGVDPNNGSPNPWPDQERESAIQRWCEAAFEEAEGDQKDSDEVNMVEKYIDYLSGKQWAPGRPSYRSRPVNNRIYRLFWELMSVLTDIRPICDIRSTVREDRFVKQEEVLNDAVRAWWVNNTAEMRTSMCIIYGMLTTGFCKQEFNPALNYGMGDIQMIPLGPRSVLPLKMGVHLQESEAVIYQDVKSCGWIKRKFPLRAHVVVPDIDVSQYQIDSGPPAHIAPQLYQRLTPAFKRMLKRQDLAGMSAYPMCKYREFWIKDYSVNTGKNPVMMGDPSKPFNVAYWVRPGEMLYPRGRLLVLAGRAPVFDGPNPYWHGLFPFSMLRLNVVPWQTYGMSDMKSLMDLQDIVNQILAGVLDMIKRAVNPPFFAPKQAFTESVWQSLDLSMPGARMAYNPASPNEPKVVQTAQLPGFVLPMQQNVQHEMDQTSNIAALTEAVKKKQVPSGDTLDTIRGAQQGPARMKGRNIEWFIVDNGIQIVPNMFQFYTGNRRVFVLGPDGQVAADKDWKGSEMVANRNNAQEEIRAFRFTVVEGSLLSAQRVEMVANLGKLRMQGDLDRHTFYEKIEKLMNVRFDVDKIEKNLIKEHQAGLAAMPPKGGKGGGTRKQIGA